MSLTSPRRAGLSDQVIAQLRNQITSGEWPVGSRIPTEPELVEQLGVARNTVREAVRALAHNGLLDIRQGSGTYVRATSELAGVMHRRFSGASPRSIAEVRSTLESSAARLAAERRTESELRQLETLLARREEAWATGEPERFVTADTTFHLAVVAASHNEVLGELYADLGDLLRNWLREDVAGGLRPEHHLDHGRLVEAIRAGDGERAAEEAAGYPFVCLGLKELYAAAREEEAEARARRGATGAPTRQDTPGAHASRGGPPESSAQEDGSG
ncbi:FadR/GntR family transcriptional regulator [Streptomyces sp. NPDC020141]|uniref:FadR/GntR family transcriptional regulator n=1 Tax=Streptomyces sp. NPDC020141 TaxID=3365065 RepID=UPI0037B1CC54